MTVTELVEHFKKHPSYLGTGTPKIAKKFNCKIEDVYTAKEIVRNNASNREDEPKIETEWEEKIRWVKTSEKSTLFVKKETEVNYQVLVEKFLDKTFTNREINWNYQNSQVTESSELCMVLCLFDIHIGRLAYSNYTGDDTDLEMQQEDYINSLNELIQNIPFDRLEKIILPIGNDYFNIDTPLLTTTNGTLQDNTTDLSNMFYLGLNLLTYTITYLSTHCPVEVLLVPGNHDRMSSNFLATSLKMIFQNNKMVEVDNSPVTRKYRQYGNTTLGFAHGELKPEKYAELLPYEAKEMFASSEYWEYLLGDKHHEKYFQIERGVVVRHLSGLTKADRWTFNNGYTTSKRRVYGILYHRTQGRCMEIVHQL